MLLFCLVGVSFVMTLLNKFITKKVGPATILGSVVHERTAALHVVITVVLIGLRGREEGFSLKFISSSVLQTAEFLAVLFVISFSKFIFPLLSSQSCLLNKLSY